MPIENIRRTTPIGEQLESVDVRDGGAGRQRADEHTARHIA